MSAAPLWMRAVTAPAARRFQKACPGVGLSLRSAAFAEGVRLLAAGAGDLHRGGIDDGRPLPAFLRRETPAQAGKGRPGTCRLPATAAFALSLALAGPAHAETLSGQARVIDGDTLAVAGRRVRLHGIDAPETRQRCTRDGRKSPGRRPVLWARPRPTPSPS